MMTVAICDTIHIFLLLVRAKHKDVGKLRARKHKKSVVQRQGSEIEG